VDPYRVWLSEVMLQQTRVETVRPYFSRWLDRFPTVEALAAASQDAVLKAWEGLGYYSRARNFHSAVREVVDAYGGEIPDDPDRFRALPGVGRYTAGAVMSIAFAREEPLVDGNVRRVFARWMDVPQPAAADQWALATEIVKGERPGDLNQALMELGATVCTPRSPRCHSCPVRSWCAAFAAGTQAARPAPRPARTVPAEEHGVAVVRNPAGELLLVRRPERGRLAGMWEFPGMQATAPIALEQSAIAAAHTLGGVQARTIAAMQRVEHAFTHVRVGYHPFACAPAGPLLPADPARIAWVAPDAIGEFALPRAQHRIAAMAAAYLSVWSTEAEKGRTDAPASPRICSEPRPSRRGSG
jgi:A/G-specific adenine glycosylase